MLTELFIANGTIFFLHLYSTYRYLKNQKVPFLSIILLGSSYLLTSAMFIEANLYFLSTPLVAETIIYVIIFSQYFLFFNMILFIFNMLNWLYYYIKRWKEWKKRK